MPSAGQCHIVSILQIAWSERWQIRPQFETDTKPVTADGTVGARRGGFGPAHGGEDTSLLPGNGDLDMTRCDGKKHARSEAPAAPDTLHKWRIRNSFVKGEKHELSSLSIEICETIAMPLFIVRHQHAPDGCPAQDPYMGASLLNHLSRPNVRKFGLHIHGEAVVQGEHTMYMIVEADDENRLRAFMQPFQMAGSLDIYSASTCVRAVASGGCAALIPPTEGVPTLDPEEVCQNAIDAGMVMHRAHPLNCETSIAALVGGVVMPNTRFYMRNNFGMPNLDAGAFRLTIGGLVERSQSFTVRDLQNMRSKTQVVTLECAGNGRSLFDRPTEGEKWGLGAVSTAEWTGVPLVEILDRAGARPDAKEVLFRGADGGTAADRSESMRFE